MLETPAPPADARIAYGKEPHQFGELRLPPGPGPHPVVVMVHGGFWRAKYDLEHVGHLCADLTKRGHATWSLEYRRVGHPDGGWTGTFVDVARGTDYLRTLATRFRDAERRGEREARTAVFTRIIETARIHLLASGQNVDGWSSTTRPPEFILIASTSDRSNAQ